MLPLDLSTVAVAVVRVGVAGGSSKAVFLIVSIGLHRRGDVERHITGGVILVISARGV